MARHATLGGWVLGICAVTTACADGGSVGDASSGFGGVCLGAGRQFYDDSTYSNACRANYNTQTLCESVDGCAWTAGTFCSGTPRSCQLYSAGDCNSNPGCRWYSPSECADEVDCNEVMYGDHGGCAFVPDTILGTCVGATFLDLGALCRGEPSTSLAIRCDH